MIIKIKYVEGAIPRLLRLVEQRGFAIIECLIKLEKNKEFYFANLKIEKRDKKSLHKTETLISQIKRLYDVIEVEK